MPATKSHQGEQRKPGKRKCSWTGGELQKTLWAKAQTREPKVGLGRALTTMGLLQTVCWQCFRAPQSNAVFRSWHSTAEPPEHFCRSGTGPVRAERKTGMRGGPLFNKLALLTSPELKTALPVGWALPSLRAQSVWLAFQEAGQSQSWYWKVSFYPFHYFKQYL